MDLLLHGVAALVLCSAFVYATTPWKFMAVSNAVFWLGREAAQWDNGSWSTSKHLEWVVPAVLGIIASYVVHRAFKSR